MKTFSKNLKTSDDHASGKAPLMKKRMLHSWYTVINYSSLAVQFSLFTLFYSRHLLLFIFLASLICRNLGLQNDSMTRGLRCFFTMSILKHVHGIYGPMTLSNSELTFRTLILIVVQPWKQLMHMHKVHISFPIDY